MIKRPILQTIKDRIAEPRRFIQILLGPRQIGKTTLVNQLITTLQEPHHYASADLATLQSSSWIPLQWNIAQAKIGEKPGILIIDEVQKIPDWANQVKGLWDNDTQYQRPLKV